MATFTSSVKEELNTSSWSFLCILDQNPVSLWNQFFISKVSESVELYIFGREESDFEKFRSWCRTLQTWGSRSQTFFVQKQWKRVGVRGVIVGFTKIWGFRLFKVKTWGSRSRIFLFQKRCKRVSQLSHSWTWRSRSQALQTNLGSRSWKGEVSGDLVAWGVIRSMLSIILRKEFPKLESLTKNNVSELESEES